jgi:hypothetical protein
MKKLSWKLKHIGNVYCSSTCGGNCTYKEYLKVLKESNIMLKKFGKNWKLDLVHNLGWYNGVRLQIDKNNWISVSKNYGAKEYHAQLNHSFNIKNHKDPKIIVQMVIDEFIEKVSNYNKTLEHINKIWSNK